MEQELLFIPGPGAGHFLSSLELVRCILDRDKGLSATIIIIPSPYQTHALSTIPHHRIRYVEIPVDKSQAAVSATKPDGRYIDSRRPYVKEVASKMVPQLLGFVVDMFCVSMIEVANEIGVPSYLFFTSGAAFLGLQMHLQRLYDEEDYDVTQMSRSESELPVPCLSKPLPAICLPSVMLSKEWNLHVLNYTRKYRETKGIVINTFLELESRALASLSHGVDTKIPRVYPVGPLVNHRTDDGGEEILRWLDVQPQSSVVFLCFGSKSSFPEDQARETAYALERSGKRFLWSLRLESPEKDLNTSTYPSDSGTLDQMLPEGFLLRTAEIGKVIGWAPQPAVLEHPSVGGFLSHCGWNSTLESIWFGVPIATWPVDAEQQFNAFQLVADLELATEISVSHRNDFLTQKREMVRSDEIEKGIRAVMDSDSWMRLRVKDMSEKSRAALASGGSSHTALGRFLQDIKTNITGFAREGQGGQS